jgi:hypothetical protein
MLALKRAERNEQTVTSLRQAEPAWGQRGHMPDDIRIKIGVSLDANAAGILAPVERGAKRARKLASASAAFKGGAAANVPLLGVLAQEAKLRGGAASATQATTSVMRFASDLTKPTTLKNWRKHGLSPFTDKSETELSDPMSIIKAALENSSDKGKAGPWATGGTERSTRPLVQRAARMPASASQSRPPPTRRSSPRSPSSRRRRTSRWR